MLVASGVVDLVDDGDGPVVMRRHGVRVGVAHDPVQAKPRKRYDKAGAKHHAAILAMLEATGACTEVIASKLGVTAQYVISLMKAMERQGLVEGGHTTPGGRYWRRAPTSA